MLVIGLTGGIGSGKSMVSAMFQKRGITVADADLIAHQLVAAGQETLGEIIECFGDQLLTPEGELDRPALRTMVFQDPQQKQRLESIIHPKVYAEITRQLNVGASIYGIADIPLLIETQHQDEVDRILVVDCSVSTQKQRIRERDQLDDTQIDHIIQSQCTREQRLDWATDIILNEGSISELEKQVEDLHRRFLSLATMVD